MKRPTTELTATYIPPDAYCTDAVELVAAHLAELLDGVPLESDAPAAQE